ncbi:MAG: MoxR family ATPase [Verrucomicrobia bacterium]|nr:MoxR family ATPase [Verrucomicrobiota bacterium]
MSTPTVLKPEELKPAAELCTRALEQLDRILLGRSDVHRLVLIGILSRGHILLEGLPGLGKTALIRTLGRILQLDFKRVQFTPDLMPGDVLGTHILQDTVSGKREMTFQPGPVFTNILLADEINRASPKTQSALLETMQESCVTLLGVTRKLPQPFFVLASQNPIELEGTYPLPEAQMDRFALQFSLGYVTAAEEVAILSAQEKTHPLDQAGAVVSKDDVLALKRAVTDVRISAELKRYIVDLVSATRTASGVSLGASPRASLSLMKVAQASALFDGSEFVTPEHVQQMAVAVIAHRVVMDPQARFSGLTARGVVEELLKKLKVPA